MSLKIRLRMRISTQRRPIIAGYFIFTVYSTSVTKQTLLLPSLKSGSTNIPNEERILQDCVIDGMHIFSPVLDIYDAY